MAKLKITLACWDYDRTRALIDGTVQPEGIDLNYLALPVEEIFWRMCQYREFDAAEMSMSAYLALRSRKNPPFIAIPVFPSRFFRHSCIFINANSGIKTPQDVRGKRVGAPEYSMTAIVWHKGIFKDDYGIGPQDVRWFVGGLEQPGRKERIDVKFPKDITIEQIAPHETLNAMLDRGAIDVLFTARAPSAFMKGSPNIKRLFEDYKKVEMDYYRRTKIFPIMHTVVIKEDIYKAHPWVAMNLYKAFCKAKAICDEAMADSSALKVSLAWLMAELEEEKQFFKGDIWPYGLEPNRHVIETLAKYSYDQGLSERLLTPDELFAENTREEFKI